MAILVYLIGVMIATYLIGRAIYYHPDNNIECSGFIVGYFFALLSWIVVIFVLITKLENYLFYKLKTT